MGARLQLFWGRWAEIRADEWVTEVLHYGYRIPFMSTPPLASEPIPFQSYHHNTERFEVLDAEIADMEKKQAIEEVRVPGPGFYSRMFVVPKASGGFRPVTYLSLLNKYINLSKFKMETPKTVLSSIRKGDWMVSIDLKDAYFHIPIHPDSRKYLRFVWKGRVWQFRSLCFGLSTAPQVFTRVMAPVAAALHRESYRVLRYLDDWLILHEEETGIALARDRTLFLVRSLGTPSESKEISTDTDEHHYVPGYGDTFGTDDGFPDAGQSGQNEEDIVTVLEGQQSPGRSLAKTVGSFVLAGKVGTRRQAQDESPAILFKRRLVEVSGQGLQSEAVTRGSSRLGLVEHR